MQKYRTAHSLQRVVVAIFAAAVMFSVTALSPRRKYDRERERHAVSVLPNCTADVQLQGAVPIRNLSNTADASRI
jgi:hypothetical protein